jgi:DHA2 family multidrug resistance protein
LHSARIGEAVSLYDAATRSRLDTLTQGFMSHGSEANQAQDMALRALDGVVRRESFVMAYNDSFLVLGVSLLVCLLFVWMGKRVIGGAGAAPH